MADDTSRYAQLTAELAVQRHRDAALQIQRLDHTHESFHTVLSLQFQTTDGTHVSVKPFVEVQAQIDMLKAEIERLKKHIVDRG